MIDTTKPFPQYLAIVQIIQCLFYCILYHSQIINVDCANIGLANKIFSIGMLTGYLEKAKINIYH